VAELRIEHSAVAQAELRCPYICHLPVENNALIAEIELKCFSFVEYLLDENLGRNCPVRLFVFADIAKDRFVAGFTALTFNCLPYFFAC
jgi:cytochrome c oxidase assembly protein Cox11